MMILGIIINYEIDESKPMVYMINTTINIIGEKKFLLLI